MKYIKEFINVLEKINKGHCDYVTKQMQELENSEIEKLDKLLQYFIMKDNSMEYIVQSYNMIVKDSMAHIVYFMKNKKYMYSSFDEVNKMLYNNPEKSKMYAIGSSITHYLWLNHIQLNRFYNKKIQEYIRLAQEEYNMPESSMVYLEAGIGGGEYFVETIKQTNFKIYNGVDISTQAVKESKDFLDYNNISDSKYNIQCIDFFQYDFQKAADLFVCSEVLEHIEQPDLFLKKIYDVTKESSFIYITTAINAPSTGHIYLFRNMDEVKELVHNAGFKIKDYVLVSNSQNKTGTLRESEPLLTAMVLSK